jgi:uncharacterized membrane protein
LLPHRSLGRKGFVVLMTVVSGLSFTTGLVFYVLGAWPVMGLLIFDALLIYIAFQMNYYAARMYERVDLMESELRITRVFPSGRILSWSFNPYWAQLDLREFESGGNRLYLRSHGRALCFGQFLSDEEKRSFADALRDALSKAR